MAIDMKNVIAESALRLIVEKNKKKITVKDIANECNITRQTFYYHFADIPELLMWVASQKREELKKQIGESLSVEESIRFWLLMGINVQSSIKKLEDSNYWEEIQQIIFDQLSLLMSEVIDQEGLELSEGKKKFFIKYHCYATIGLMSNWSKAPEEDVDRMVTDIKDIIMGNL